MRHTITVASNPRILIFFFILAALPAVGIMLMIFAGLWIGIIALAAAAYLDYTMFRSVRNHLKSWVESSDDGLTCQMPDGENIQFSWGNVAAAGYCTQERGRPFLFVYRLEGDKLVTIPNEYSDFDALVATIKKYTPFGELSLGQGETIQAHLKDLLDIKSSEEKESAD